MPARPNFIVFFTDQQRHDSLGVHGNPLGLTPHLDDAAQHHTLFEHFLTPQPVCTPARACLQTGLHATTCGVWRLNLPLDPEADTIAKRLRGGGYQTAYLGKWHLAAAVTGHGPVPEPNRGGYEYWLAADVLEHTSQPYHTRVWDAHGTEHVLPGHRVDALTDAAIRYLDRERDANRPFFLMLSHLEPHAQNDLDAFVGPKLGRQRYAGRWTPPDLQALTSPAGREQGKVGGRAPMGLADYWAMCRKLDDAYGRMLDALDTLGLLDNTVVIFTSDHGDHFHTRLAHDKASAHEASIRVPGVFRGPGFERGGRVQELASLLDIPPTLLDLAGLEVPEAWHGRSLMPLVRGEVREATEDAPDNGWPAARLIQTTQAAAARAVRTRRWKYIVHALDEDALKKPHPARYVEAELYDLEHDPWELNNRLNDPRLQTVQADLRGRLHTLMQQAGEPPATIEPAS